MNMKRAVAAVLLFAASALGWAQTADDLVAKNLVARGGAEKLRAIQSMAITGTIQFGEASSPITVRARRPNQIREEFEVEGTAMTRGFDGAAGWLTQKKREEIKTQALSGGESDNIREEAENAIEGPLLDYAKKGSKAESLGKDTVDGQPVYKLRVTTHLGTSITEFLDASTYLEIYEEIERSVNGKPITIVEQVGDYRAVGGVKFAHRFVSGPRENPAASKFQVDKIELNVRMDAGVFAMPKP